MEVKTEKLPKTPLALYVKFYSKRKNTKCNNNRIEATKSWLSLCQLEKEKFIEKHEQYQNKFKRKFANYLKNAEPYLKKKDPTSRSWKPDMVYEEPQPDANIVNNTLQTTQSNSVEDDRSHISNRIDLVDCVPQPETLQESIPAEDQQNTSTQEYMESVLVEPTPPSLKTGRELFELVKMMEVNHLTWISLSPSEKRSYNAAVLSLKKDYIKKYKTYLENLPSKELFDHYNIKCSTS